MNKRFLAIILFSVIGLRYLCSQVPVPNEGVKEITLDEILQYTLTESPGAKIGINSAMQQKTAFAYQEGALGFNLATEVRTGYEKKFGPGAESDPFVQYAIKASYNLLNFSNLFPVIENEGDASMELARTIAFQNNLTKSVIDNYSKLIFLEMERSSIYAILQRQSRLKEILDRAKSNNLTNLDVLEYIQTISDSTKIRLRSIEEEVSYVTSQLLLRAGYASVSGIKVKVLDLNSLNLETIFENINTNSDTLFNNTKLVRALGKALELYNQELGNHTKRFLPNVDLFAEAGKRSNLSEVGGTDGLTASGGIAISYEFFDGNRSKNRRIMLTQKINAAKLTLNALNSEHTMLREFVLDRVIPKIRSFKTREPEIVRRENFLLRALPRTTANLESWQSYSTSLIHFMNLLSETMKARADVISNLIYFRYIIEGSTF